MNPAQIDIIIIGLWLAGMLIGLSVWDEWRRDISPRRKWRDKPMATKINESINGR